MRPSRAATTCRLPAAPDPDPPRTKKAAQFSVDANLLHSVVRARCWRIRQRKRRQWSISAPSRRWTRPTRRPIRHRLRQGRPVSLDGKKLSPPRSTRWTLGKTNGIGRLDLVENRFVGMKKSPRHRDAGRHDLRLAASRDGVDHARPWRSCSTRRRSMPRYAELIYNGFLVYAGAPSPGPDRPETRSTSRARCPQALQGQR